MLSTGSPGTTIVRLDDGVKTIHIQEKLSRLSYGVCRIGVLNVVLNYDIFNL